MSPKTTHNPLQHLHKVAERHAYQWQASSRVSSLRWVRKTKHDSIKLNLKDICNYQLYHPLGQTLPKERQTQTKLQTVACDFSIVEDTLK